MKDSTNASARAIEVLKEGNSVGGQPGSRNTKTPSRSGAGIFRARILASSSIGSLSSLIVGHQRVELMRGHEAHPVYSRDQRPSGYLPQVPARRLVATVWGLLPP